jgi:hypothetical protein
MLLLMHAHRLLVMCCSDTDVRAAAADEAQEDRTT